MVYTIADLVWPALLLEGRILTWWAILAGLIIEYFFVRMITDLSRWKGGAGRHRYERCIHYPGDSANPRARTRLGTFPRRVY
jgi:hypothetical protein